MKDYTQVERDNAALTIREYAFGQINMLRMLGDEDAANNLQEAINMAIAALREPAHEWVRTTDRLPMVEQVVVGLCGGKVDIYQMVNIDDFKRYVEYWCALPLRAVSALRGPQPDPDTGLMRCGCGGEAKVWPSDLRQAMVTAYQVGCIKCATTTVWVRGKQENAMNVWNTAMGCPDCGRPLSGNPEQEGF